MLTTCPECELQVSDKAYTCPHCGYPLKTAQKEYKPSTKHRRLPNGFGQISLIKNRNLRKPYRAMVSIGKTETGKPICRILKPHGYFATYNEAYAALMEYNKNPYDLAKGMTMQELYNNWYAEYKEKDQANSTLRTAKSAWSRCTEISSMLLREVRTRHIKSCVDNAETPGLKKRVKSLLNMLFDYAMEYELVDRNYARAFQLGKEVYKEQEEDRVEHIAFTDKEIDVLWENIDRPYVDVVLAQCYTGFRPQELGLITIDNVHLDEGYIVGGMKTDAGRNRPVPIHSKILSIIEKHYWDSVNSGEQYLFTCKDAERYADDHKLTYNRYTRRFALVRDSLGLNIQHRPHDPRVHFVTQAKRAGVDEYAIKYIVGHSIQDITENIYTKRNIEWLKSEIEKIK